MDTLIDLVIAAPDRAALVARTRALDRVLLAGHYMIPHFHITAFRVALLGPLRPAGRGAEERDRLRHVVGRPEPGWGTPLVLAYLARRLLLVIPTLFGIMLANFLIVQAAPGGPGRPDAGPPARARGPGHGPDRRHRDGGDGTAARGAPGRRRRRPHARDAGHRSRAGAPAREAVRLRQAGVAAVRAHDAQLPRLRLRQSFYRDRPVLGLMLEKLPVSISLGLWTTLLVYLISIPLGVAKAVRDGTPFDVWTSARR